MTNLKDIRQNILAGMAALAVSGMCVLGTVGPVQANDPSQPVQLQADPDMIIVTGQIA
ncbi:hypothetical protein [Parasphingopyxis sp.]|uniref:hypothetical protein n=1 Tax=Parasphingopyxis sp. TaxID=1920299 RepID=UPI002623717F|nr:hypothetical protein [Parasphingopyxis sp.]